MADVARAGRPTANGGTGPAAGRSAAPAAHPDDPQLAQIMRRRDLLGDEPPEFNIVANDAAYGAHGAHTDERHGPGVPLPRDPARRTIEGRIYGDDPWGNPENWSFRWTDPSTMNRTVNDYVRNHWTEIRDDLALNGRHDASFNAGHRVGQGYYNDGMYGAGPRNSHYAETSFVKIRIRLLEGSDPPEPFILTSFPLGIM
ncbi:hypothetical protein ODJ79_39455 [Actinoplanes sp. KI2]|uniref:hypothetical protein n=1 Tax=Actinoplanes sp. KI2 TaxID=2983315 RepID=UPI0021D5ABD2|nr:hypothetical protein [Actinoplanes sp. KI2]MCU7729829.1 hypothetical protein [Actinoplanes sp. KI2]